MSDLREAAEMALEALEMGLGQRPGDYEQAIKVATSATIALHKVLGQPKREWVGLTDDEVMDICNEHYEYSREMKCAVLNVLDHAKAIEAKLKEKNT